MLNTDNQGELLWKECLSIFNRVNNNTLEEFLDNLISFVKNNENKLSKVADMSFLIFAKSINSNMFVVGSTKDDFECIVNNYSQTKSASEIEVWRIISNIIWDLITMTTEEICPQCKSDHLRILTDVGKSTIYKECETCFWTEVDGKGIKRPNGLLPADKKVLSKLGLYHASDYFI